MKKFSVASMIFITLLGGCNSSPVNLYSDTTMKKNEYNGIKAYRKGQFETAFNYLKEPAGLGYKSAQYTLAFMFLKGQYLTQSTKLGMGWLGVAAEAGIDKWSSQYSAFYNAASVEQQQQFDEIVALYKQQYGLKSQNVSCQKSVSAKHRFNEVKVDCEKYEGTVTTYSIELVE
jgi:TPR repeat protein